MEGFESKITACSNSEMSKRDQLKMMDLTNAIQLENAITANGQVEITPEIWAIVAIVNPRSKGEKEYTKFVLIDDAGKKWQTGSESFMQAFKQINDFMEGEPFSIVAYGVESKNFPGRNFLTCAIL